MGGTSERTFLTSLLALDADAPAPETIDVALRCLMVLTRARYARAEIRASGESRPMVRVTAFAPSSVRTTADEGGAPPLDVVSSVFETGFITARLELRSRRPGLELTFRERELFDHLFQAMARFAQRTRLGTVFVSSLHEATREFQARLVANALERAQGNVTRAARELRVTRAFVYKFMRGASADTHATFRDRDV